MVGMRTGASVGFRTKVEGAFQLQVSVESAAGALRILEAAKGVRIGGCRPEARS